MVGYLGYAFGKTLVYTNGGVAFARIKNIGGDVNGGILTLSDAHVRDDVFFGPTVEIGIERFIAERLIGRIEYSYTDFGSFSQANRDGAPGSQVYRIDNGPIQKLSFGVAYKF